MKPARRRLSTKFASDSALCAEASAERDAIRQVDLCREMSPGPLPHALRRKLGLPQNEFVVEQGQSLSGDGRYVAPAARMFWSGRSNTSNIGNGRPRLR